MAQVVELNPFFRQVEMGIGSRTDLTSRAFRVAVLSAEPVHGIPPRVPGQPGHAPAVTVERPTGRTSFAIRARSALAEIVLGPNTMRRGMPGVRSRRAAGRDVGLGGPPAPDRGARRRY
jgi:hypothetical protein